MNLNKWEIVNVTSLGVGVVALGWMGIHSLSPSLSPSPTPTITVSLPADSDTGEGTVLLRPSAMYPCTEEDGTLPPNVNACYWDARGNGSSFIILRK